MVLGKRNIRLLLMLAAFGLMLAGAAFLWFVSTCACKSAPAPNVKRTVVIKEVVKVKEVERPKIERTLLTEEGAPIGLSEIAPNRKVALVVVKGNWCRVCTSEIERLSARAHEVWGAEAMVAVVNDHQPSQNAAFADETGTPFQVLSDHDYDQLREWGLYRDGMDHPIPGVVFLDESGTLVKVHRGRYPGRPQTDYIIDTLGRL